jgi:sulfite reductase subunit B
MAIAQEQKEPKADLYVPELATVTRITTLTALEKMFRIKFKSGRPLGQVPGQFVEVSVFGIGEAPVSICSAPTSDGSFELTVRRVGNVTNSLHAMDQGATVGIRGPFGNGFDMAGLKGQDILVVAGGIGLAPLRSVIQYIFDHRGDYGKFTILYGTKTPPEMLFTDELKQWAADPKVDFRMTVDRGDEAWKGHVGVITTLIPEVEIDKNRTVGLIVGPPVMYRFVVLSLRGKGLADDHMIMSLERRMKCGVGKCGHCQMNGLYVCQDGPVFNYAQIRDYKGAI